MEHLGVGSVARMRRLLLLAGVLVFVDTMLYAALTPLLPRFAHDFELSKAGAGTLVAAYAAGALIGGLPGGFAAVRLGPRRAVLVGLALMGLSSVGFALAESFSVLFAARLFQGMGSAFTWAGAFAWLLAAAPRERRGELIGAAMGAAVAGALFGPVVGAAAALLGRAAIFSALGGLAAVLALWTVRIASPPPERPSAGRFARAFGNRRFLGGLALMSLASVLEGYLYVLAPLHLSAAGWGATAIGAVWLLSAGIEAAGSPLIGRLSDRRGALLPVRVALGIGVVVSLVLSFAGRPLVYAPLLLIASVSYGALFTPAMALIADGADRVGLMQGLAFGLMNAAWAVGAVIGPSAGGAIAGATGDWVPFILAAALCAAYLAATRGSSYRPSVAEQVSAVPGGR
ncbi:MAG: Arabinose efflux permease [Solirubrobacterales bacterium]|nr:Arabinose efflux permease [Solirubrobacterales bacterium]